jgi:hypothetical protein
VAKFHIDITQFDADGKITGSPIRLIAASLFTWVAQLKVMRMTSKVVVQAHQHYGGLGDFDFRELDGAEVLQLGQDRFGSIAEVKYQSGEVRKLFLVELYQAS